MNKYVVIGIGVALSIILSFILGSKLTNTKAAKPITIAVAKTPLSAPFYVAEALELFDSNCIEPRYIDLIGGHSSFDYLVSGKADYATSSDSVIVHQSAIRDDFSTLGAFVQSDNDIKLVTHGSYDLTKYSLHRELQVGMVEGSASEYFLYLYLAFMGIDKNNVNFVHFSAEQLPNALIDKEVDAIAVWEPYAYNALSMMAGEGKVIDSESLYTLTFNLLTRRKSVHENLDASICLLEAINEATRYINTTPEDAKNIVKNRLGLEDDFIDWIWKDYVFKLSLGQSLLLNLESQARWSSNSSDSDLNMSEFIEPDALLEVNPAAVSIRLKGQR